MEESEKAPLNITAIIEARMNSSRLPGKVMLPVFGKPLLELMVSRVRRAKMVNDVVIATTINKSDDKIWNANLGAFKYRGSEDDVLGRVLGAAQVYNTDIIVELTGDCPLIDPAMIDKVVADYLLGGADFCYSRLEAGTPIGMDVRVFSTKSLAEVAEKTKDPADREHVSLYFWEHPKEYRCRNVGTDLPGRVADLRLTVDTQEDFTLIEKIYHELYPTKHDFNLFDIVDLFDRKPELQLVNAYIEQKAVR